MRLFWLKAVLLVRFWDGGLYVLDGVFGISKVYLHRFEQNGGENWE